MQRSILQFCNFAWEEHLSTLIFSHWLCCPENQKLNLADLEIYALIQPYYFFYFPIIGPKIKFVVNFIYEYQNLSGEKYKSNRKRISSIRHTSEEKNPKNHPKTPYFRKVVFSDGFLDFSLLFSYNGEIQKVMWPDGDLNLQMGPFEGLIPHL